MCSINDHFQEDKIDISIEKLDIAKIRICNKCKKEKPIVLLRHKDGYCKSCFLNGTIHKFKTFFGKHRLIKNDDHVLINYRFGHPITSLMSFLRVIIDQSTPKQLNFVPIVLYIEKNYDLSVIERKRMLKQINEEIKQFSFTVYFISFFDYIINSKIDLKTNYNDVTMNEDINAIDKIYHPKASDTVQADFYKQLETQLLIESAKKIACQHIFMCDIAIDVASQILTNISLGRGGYLQMDVGACDTRNPYINIIKPLRFFDIKELALYNYFNNISPVAIKKKQNNIYSSVQNMTTNFIQHFQTYFPSTISTVVKTGDKLSIDKTVFTNEKCKICSVPIKKQSADLTSAAAIEFSHWLSVYKSNCKMQLLDKYNHVQIDFKQDKEKYCFSCSRISKYLIK